MQDERAKAYVEVGFSALNHILGRLGRDEITSLFENPPEPGLLNKLYEEVINSEVGFWGVPLRDITGHSGEIIKANEAALLQAGIALVGLGRFITDTVENNKTELPPHPILKTYRTTLNPIGIDTDLLAQDFNVSAELGINSLKLRADALAIMTVMLTMDDGYGHYEPTTSSVTTLISERGGLIQASVHRAIGGVDQFYPLDTNQPISFRGLFGLVDLISPLSKPNISSS